MADDRSMSWDSNQLSVRDVESSGWRGHATTYHATGKLRRRLHPRSTHAISCVPDGNVLDARRAAAELSLALQRRDRALDVDIDSRALWSPLAN